MRHNNKIKPSLFVEKIEYLILYFLYKQVKYLKIINIFRKNNNNLVLLEFSYYLKILAKY
jgi:hypothetical protein